LVFGIYSMIMIKSNESLFKPMINMESD
jgi:hypothetical protein